LFSSNQIVCHSSKSWFLLSLTLCSNITIFHQMFYNFASSNTNLSLQKRSQYMLIPFVFMKPGVDFIIVLHTPFSTESLLRSLSLVMFWLCNFFWRKSFVSKAARKMLMKLTAGCLWDAGDCCDKTRSDWNKLCGTNCICNRK